MARQNSVNKRSSDFTVDSRAGFDSFVQFNINDTGEFRVGADISDDSFRIAQGSNLGVNETFIMTAAGGRTMPLQPAFLVTQDVEHTDVTGNGVLFTMTFDTEELNIGSVFDGTSTFTAPVDGLYDLEARVNFKTLNAVTHLASYIKIVTSNRTFSSASTSGPVASFIGDLATMVTAFSDMDAADTAIVQIIVFGGTQTVGTYEGSSAFNKESFSGNLVC